MIENQVNTIVVPKDFPVPAFKFGQKVYLKDSDNAWGTVVGMRCIPLSSVPRYWEYVFHQRVSGSSDWYDENELSLTRWPDEEE